MSNSSSGPERILMFVVVCAIVAVIGGGYGLYSLFSNWF